MSLRSAPSIGRTSCRVGLSFLLLVLAGCLGGKKTAIVHGKVTVDKRPMTGGTIVFMSADGKRTGSTQINSVDGTYRIANAPVGSVQITVESIPTTMLPVGPAPKGLPAMRDPNNPDEPATNTAPGKFVQLPARYKDPKASGLTYEVLNQTGEQEHNVELSAR